MIYFAIILLVPLYFLVVYQYPWLGILGLISIVLVKFSIRSYFPFLVSYTYDLAMLAGLAFATWANYSKNKGRLHVLRRGKAPIVWAYYFLLFMALLSFHFSRDFEAAYKEVLIFGVYIQIVFWSVLVYFRSYKDLSDVLNINFVLAFFSMVLILFFPISFQERAFRAGDAVLGSNPLAPSDFLAMTCIWLWVHFLENGRYKRLVWLVPIFLLSIVASSIRAPLLFVPIIMLTSLFSRSNVKKMLYGLIIAVIFTIAGFLYIENNEIVQLGAERFYALKSFKEESRYVLPALALAGWVERGSILALIIGGGIGDSSYSIGDGSMYAYPHNWLVEILVELGLIPFVVLCAFFIVIVRGVLRFIRFEKYYNISGIDNKITIITFGYIGLYWVFNSFKTGSYTSSLNAWFFMLLSYMAINATRTKKISEDARQN